jgi:hypothetical protein
VLIPLYALSLVTHLIIAVADSVPRLDVTASCRGAAAAASANEAKDRMQKCLESEQRSHDLLAKEWEDFTLADRMNCVSTVRDFEPTYTELLTCLEMMRDVKKLK